MVWSVSEDDFTNHMKDPSLRDGGRNREMDRFDPPTISDVFLIPRANIQFPGMRASWTVTNFKRLWRFRPPDSV